MPAFFLLIRIGRFPVPLPWFILWLLLLPLVPLAILVSPFFRSEDYGRVMQNAHRAWWVLVALHGLKVEVNGSSGEQVYLSFV